MNETIITSTATSLRKSFHQCNVIRRSGFIDECPSVFLDEQVLARPPFHYFVELVKFISNAKPSLKWEALFFGNEGESNRTTLTKKEKLTFLVRLLAVVSKATETNVDIFVSPSKTNSRIRTHIGAIHSHGGNCHGSSCELCAGSWG